jgi:hypothetical protein
VSLQLALDLPNQQTNASLGLIDSVEARYARSLLATNPAGLSTGNLDPYYFSLGASIRNAIANPGTYSQEELARAVAFAKGVGSYSLGTDFDASSLTWGQSVAGFFSQSFRFQAELFNSASADSDPGNNGSLIGSWTSVNPDVDVQQQLDGTINVGWTATGEWLEWTRPPQLTNGTYSVNMSISRGAGGTCSGTVNGVSFSTPDTGSWSAFEVRSNLCQVPVTGATTAFRLTFDQGFNLDWLELTRTT